MAWVANLFFFFSANPVDNTSFESAKVSVKQLKSQRQNSTNAKLVMADNEYLAEDSGIVEEESVDRPSFTVSKTCEINIWLTILYLNSICN